MSSARTLALLPLGIIALFSNGIPLRADEPIPTQKQVLGYIRQLGSDEFEEREEASQRLENIGEYALLEVRKAIYSKDAEVSHRAVKLAKAIQAKLTGAIRIFSDHRHEVWAVSPMPDGKHFLSGSYDKTLLRVEAATGKVVRRYEGHAAKVKHSNISADGRFGISGSGEVNGDDCTVRVWNLETGKQEHLLEGHTSRVLAVAFVPKTYLVVSGSHDRTLRVWDLKTGKTVHVLKGHTERVRTVAVSPDARFIVSGSFDNTVRVWDVKTGEERLVFRGHSNMVMGVTVSANGKWVASAGADGAVRLWDIETGKERAVFSDHVGFVYGVALSKDGSQLVSCGEDKTIRLFDIESGQQIRKYEGHQDYVMAVSFLGDGKHLVSASKDRTLRLWALPKRLAGADSPEK